MAHVPRILYHWRVHQVSTADNPISKTYAFEAGQRAIEAHLLRCGEHAEVYRNWIEGFIVSGIRCRGIQRFLF